MLISHEDCNATKEPLSPHATVRAKSRRRRFHRCHPPSNMSLEENFNAAAQRIRDWHPARSPSDDEKLRVYGLYKQATAGDNTTTKPGMFDWTGQKKWGAWEACKVSDRIPRCVAPEPLEWTFGIRCRPSRLSDTYYLQWNNFTLSGCLERSSWLHACLIFASFPTPLALVAGHVQGRRHDRVHR